MPHGFAVGWYMPRLAQMRRDLPGIEPWVATSDVPPDFTRSEVDFAVVRGRGEWDGPMWDGLMSAKLFDDALRPMCAPALRRLLPEVVTPHSLLTLPLLHHEADEDWPRWFAGQGLMQHGLVAGLNFSDAGLALDAAARGLGICLGSDHLAAERLANGALVACGAAIPAKAATFLLTDPRNLKRPWVAELWDWFLAQSPDVSPPDLSPPAVSPPDLSPPASPRPA